MIRLGLRLALSGGSQAVTRLVAIAVAVTLGVGLLLATLAGVNAVNAQNARYAWLNTVTEARSTPPDGASAGGAVDPLWWLMRGDYFDGQSIGRVEVAATGPHSPVPPGIPHLPGPGEYYASPAMSALLRSTPADELGDRFDGHQIGTIGPAALPAPNSLLIITGYTPAELSTVPGATSVTSIQTTVPSSCGTCSIGMNASAMDLILSVVACALIFPVLMFIGTATRLAAARREQRFAAMRLVGAAPRQISVISAVESTIAAAVGTALGFGLFFLLRDPLAAFPFTGQPFFPTDLSPNAADVLAVAIGIPVAAAVAARVALRRVHVSPLGVTRRVTPRAPRAYRMIPLVVGIGELAYFHGRVPSTSGGQVAAFLPGFLVIMVGLVVAGPWLTMVGSRLMTRRAGRPATLIAARRLADNPQAGFRAVSGLILALFVTSVAVGVITTIVDNRGAPSGSTEAGVLTQQLPPDPRLSGRSAPAAGPSEGTVPAGLSSIPGVRGVLVVHAAPAAPAGRTTPPATSGRAGGLRWQGVISCADLSHAPDLGKCPVGAAVASVPPSLTGPGTRSGPGTIWPAATVSPDLLASLPMLSVVVPTDGSTSAIEQARTVLEAAYPAQPVPATGADYEAATTNDLTGWQQLADVVILTSLPIAGCSLAVSVVGGLSDRRRPFSLLRLTGVPLGVLRRVVALESALPLLAVAVVAVGTGFLAAALFLSAQMGYTLRAPGVGYWVMVAAGIAACLGIIASTLPLLRRITGPETARNE